MAGFDKKVVHIAQEGHEPVMFTLEIDFLSDGSWKPYQSFALGAEQNYLHHEVADRFSSPWVRVRVDKDYTATVYFN